MKKLALIAIAFATLSLSATCALAEVSIGIIDTRKIVDESAAGKSLSVQLKARQEQLQKEATAFEQKLRAEEQDIIAKRKEMKPEEFDAKKKAFEQEFMKSRQAILTKSSDLDTVRKKALAELQKNLAKAAADIADEKKLSMIVDRQFVILAEESMDITAVVMKKLNETVKEIPLGK
ncbi:MAG: hypothetical protein DI586_08415 [Micavibrio aeruginosavorus]|uniref:Outer membrane family protein n=1 Tax=Micavibrio aeruginosavorus TaxID=349221 RepID=A0A2W5FMD3_9BACT|nr:MAG: hypothetical protein DI586_08415 [Micavibrio aeruginosavorus]